MKFPPLVVFAGLCVYMFLLLFTLLEAVAFVLDYSNLSCVYRYSSVNDCTVVCPENLNNFDKTPNLIKDVL